MKIFTLVLFILVSIITYNLLKIFVLSNFKINKWVVLGLFLVVFGLSFSIRIPIFLMYIVQWLYFILILWFLDIYLDDRREKLKIKNKKVIKNRPKPKKSRMK